jgi:adenosylmethionine---8-amino-7-oxononanoate aminotransferase
VKILQWRIDEGTRLGLSGSRLGLFGNRSLSMNHLKRWDRIFDEGRHMRSTSPVWHPFTQQAVHGEIPTIVRNDGAWLEADDGRRIFDAISSWWVVTHGHRYPPIMAAIRAQTELLDQIIFAGFTHPRAEELARRLVAITPSGLEHVFFSDSGSTAVEVALKMALGFWLHSGEPRRHILALEGAYHGDTIGGMSVGERGVFNAPYEPLLFDVSRLPFPHKGREQQTLGTLDRACRVQAVAALIVEPLILGAGGMLIYEPAVLAEMARICKSHGVLLIADEVMTGWGRTGTLFACEQADVVPDIACYSKGLTGGSLPLAVTLCGPAIFDAHYSQDRRKTFFHSSSYTANPIACAAAVANLTVWQTEPVRERIAALAAAHAKALDGFRDDRRFANVRQLGTIAALDLAVGDAGYLAGIGPRLYRHFMDRGFLVRPLGNTIYLMPPYCSTAEEIGALHGAIAEIDLDS